ncbi:AmmeMemoRadiSam system radical SAM enzyme [Desulfovibrio sp. OttesenSCG-928-C06]|nr:AmmeMemoRadiSam system radical SAM enzyme [Desulfovibrio sp. OttesenSCG-928-C06]
MTSDLLSPASLWEKEPKAPGASDVPCASSASGASGTLDASNLPGASGVLGAQEGDCVRCFLCAHYCRIRPGGSGVCGVRFNRGGALFTAVGCSVGAVNLDPVEKKPLFHFLPGSKTFSFGTPGCNMRCKFCQNSDLSQVRGSDASQKLQSLAAGRRATTVTPAGLVEAARQSGAASIAYTYNEPGVFFELMSGTATMALEHGLRNVMVSNGYISGECFSELKDLVQAANIDLKSFSNDFYRELCGASLAPVLRTLRLAAKAGWLLEVTTLVIGGVNDSRGELEELAGFIAGELGQDVPWHVSRFRPAYLMRDIPPTGLDSLERAIEAGKKSGLKYIYAGNVPGHPSENTSCPACGTTVLERFAYTTKVNWGAEGPGKCPQCGADIHGLWL